MPNYGQNDHLPNYGRMVMVKEHDDNNEPIPFPGDDLKNERLLFFNENFT